MIGTLAERFWSKVLKSDGCWLWMGVKVGFGYGQISDQGKMRLAHRVAYEFVKGPIPEGLTIDHLCRQPACCNPDHLEAVTGRVNTLRGTGVTAKNARKVRCKRGHLFSVKNTCIRSVGGRTCRKCMRLLCARWRKARRESQNPA